MGKSEKKIKSDRINSLRKKYDAFVEEDKKRKERNEYILEKLDKMRYCNAMVPVRQKSSELTESRTTILQSIPRPSIESSINLPLNDQYLQLASPKKHVDETILQEISKKYILIPKLKQTCDDYVTDGKPKIVDNTDWKSKYQILEQLKRDEKEQDSTTHHEIFQADQEHPNITYNETKIKDEEKFLKYKSEIPDLPENKLSYNLQSCPNFTEESKQRYIDIEVNDTSETANYKLGHYKNSKNKVRADKLADNINGSFENYENNAKDDVYDQGKSGNDTEFVNKNDKNYEHCEETVVGSKIRSESDNAAEIGTDTPRNLNLQTEASLRNIENEYIPLEYDSKLQPQVNDFNQETYLDKEEVTLVHDINAGDVINVLNNEVAPEENTEYPVETIDVQDFTPHDDVQLEDGVNINPKPQALVNQDDLAYNYDPIVEPDKTTNPANTFEAEQTQEFYNDQANQNYDYTEEVLQDNYNTEYTAPDENYEQTEYAYYEGAQTEQAYQEVADNDETSQRYDQNYEQQYGATYEQEAYPQQGYEQGYTEQGFEQPEYTEQIQHNEATDQAQQGLEKLHYENPDGQSPQYVEQQLDNEQGYIEKQNDEISSVEKPGEKMENLKSGDQQVQ